MNTAEVLSDEDMERTGQISERYYQNEHGESIPWLTEHEKDCLRIRKGTLLPAERKIMENHVVMTQQFLKEIEFSKEYRDVPVWAVSHHEFLDGSGYPEGLREEEICQEVRLLTVLDIFDSLIAEDRPYRPPMPVEKALAVLESMVSEGKLDRDMVALFKESKAWEEERK